MKIGKTGMAYALAFVGLFAALLVFGTTPGVDEDSPTESEGGLEQLRDPAREDAGIDEAETHQESESSESTGESTAIVESTESETASESSSSTEEEVPPPASIEEDDEKTNVGGIGRTYQNGKWTMHFVQDARAGALDEYTPAGDGQEFYMLDLQVENTGSTSTFYQDDLYAVVDSNGNEYPLALGAPEHFLPTLKLQEGVIIRGWIAYEVPIGTDVVAIRTYNVDTYDLENYDVRIGGSDSRLGDASFQNAGDVSLSFDVDSTGGTLEVTANGDHAANVRNVYTVNEDGYFTQGQTEQEERGRDLSEGESISFSLLFEGAAEIWYKTSSGLVRISL